MTRDDLLAALWLLGAAPVGLVGWLAHFVYTNS